MYIKIFIKRKLKFYAEENFYTTHKKTCITKIVHSADLRNCRNVKCEFAELCKCAKVAFQK